MKRTKLKKTIIWLGAITVSLFIVLIIHIAMVTDHKNNDSRARQLSRIDFKQKIDAKEANNIRAFVAKMPGVESTYFNVENGILIYTYQVEKQNSQNVYEQLMSSGKYKAERYVVSKEEAQSGCPVSPNSITYKVTAYLANIIN